MAKKNTVEIILSARDQASGAVRKAFGAVESSASAAMGAVKTGAIAAGAALITLTGVISKVGVSYNAMMEQSLIAWETIQGTAEQAKDTVNRLMEMGAQTPFEVEGLDKAAKLLDMAGFKGEDLFKTLTQVGDAVSAIGGGQEELAGISLALFQISTKGKISAQEMNQLAERGIPAWDMLAKGMGKSVQEVMKLSENGKLFASEALPMILNQMGERFGGAMEKQSHTFNGMISTAKDYFKMISAELSKPLFDKLKAGMEFVLPMIEKFKNNLQTKGVMETLFPPSVLGVMQKFGQGLGIVKEGIRGVVALFDGNKGKGISALSVMGLNSEAIQFTVAAVDKIKAALNGLKGAFDILTGDSIGGITFLTKMGFSTDTIVKIVDVVNGIKQTISDFVTGYIGYIKNLFSGEGNIGQSFVRIFETVKSIALPILQDAISFIKGILANLKAFWDENGAQIIEAVKNVWSIIAGIFKFIAPVILFILNMLWTNVKGVISGALDVIMGIIKVFAGLFTGDFGKMWEGVKQIFFGAIEAVWNLINLLMIGRILGGIKSFITSGVSAFQGFWTKTVEVFRNLDTHVWNIITSFASKIWGVLKGFVNNAVSTFNTLRTFGANIFQSLWAAIQSTVSNMVSGVINFFRSMFTGAKYQFEGFLNTAKNIFNAVKEAITNPIETAKNLVGKAIDAIKGFFRNIGNGIKIPLPHFSVKMGKKDVGGVSIPWPDFDVSWYDKGGVFYGPQVIGVGEKRPEFVGALDDLRKIVREESGGNQQVVVQSPPQYAVININGRQAMLAMIDYIEEEMEFREQRRKSF